ncbi:MAG: DegT/DnrJ/EryC1/StrS aminotransferase family protein [Candidatus Parvarchaeota archaeon]|nr:DegT/DnrJ/EryC1/StrS aminotransferase family protein [Candidatus Jingweiarchaeum tengchongense]
MIRKIPLAKPSITELEISYVCEAVKNGWGDLRDYYITLFEERFKSYLGVKYAIATSSCTGALHMGLKALGIGPGDEVILADTNWIATVAPVIHLGATPIFVDILEDSWCIDPEKVERSITKKTKAIIVTHLYGNLCEMEKLIEISQRYGLFIVEDAAEALGSVYHGKKAGSMGTFGVFSFHGSKTITTGEGGMFVTNDPDLYEAVLTLSNHGRRRGQTKQFWPETVGFKYKMSNIQAALGCAQLERIEVIISKKREILSLYKKHLEALPGVKMNPEPEGTFNSAWMPTVVFPKELNITREMLVSEFSKKNIDARVFFWPLSSLKMFKPAKYNINAWDIPRRAICLPSYYDMGDDEILSVIDVIYSILRRVK